MFFHNNVATINQVEITYDLTKRDKTLVKRGIDFADAIEVFAGTSFDFQDDRKDYGEIRIITIGHLCNRMMVGLDSPW